MATRRENEAQRKALEDALAREYSGGESGRMLPSVREIASRHGVSLYNAQQAVRSLEARGVLRTVARVGTFVDAEASSALEPSAALEGAPFEYFALVANGNERDTDLVRSHSPLYTGFENRIAERGGAVLTMSTEQVKSGASRGELPFLRGVFDLAWSERGPFWATEFVGSRLPQVRFGVGARSHARSDSVSFNDEEGGAQATRHLLKCGHERIAFLAVHAKGEAEPLLEWSARRERGWQRALELSGASAQGLAFHSEATSDGHNLHDLHEQARTGRDASGALLPLLRSGEVTAVVAANDAAALGLLEAMRADGVPPARVPAIVGFDADPNAGRHLLTSLRLPWDELGRVAADLLWERAHGELPASPQHREAQMRLIPRLSCRPQWSLRSGHSALVTETVLASPVEASGDELSRVFGGVS